MFPVQIKLTYLKFLFEIKKNDSYNCLKPVKTGLSPGAVLSDMTFNELMCVSVRTVPATNHGSPTIEHIAMIRQIISKSR